MDWGWIVLIAVLVLLALPLFVPVIVRVRAESEAKEFEYAVTLGPFALLPDMQANLACYKRKIGRPLYYISRPFVWIFRLLIIVLRAIFWPFQKVARLFRRKPSMLPPESEIRQPDEGVEARATVFRFDEEGEKEEAEAGKAEWRADLDTGDRPDEWDRSDDEFFSESEDGPDTFDAYESYSEAEKKRSELPGSSLWSKFGQAKAGYAKGMEMLRRYGRTGKRTLRAGLLFLRECMQTLSFNVFELRWSVGGDPAALGQILGWHHMFTGMLDPRVQRHVHFDPLWDSEPLSPSGQANVVLYVWPYRFIPPIMRLLFRMPWWGLIRIAREQIFQRK